MRGTGPIEAELERRVLGAVVPGGEPGDEDVHDGAVHVLVQLDTAVRPRVHRAAARRRGLLVRAVRGHAQPAGLRVPQRRVPEGNPAGAVLSHPVRRRFRFRFVHATDAPQPPPSSQSRPQPCPPAGCPPVGQRVGAQFPDAVGRVPALVRLAHAAASRLRRHLQSGESRTCSVLDSKQSKRSTWFGRLCRFV